MWKVCLFMSSIIYVYGWGAWGINWYSSDQLLTGSQLVRTAVIITARPTWYNCCSDRHIPAWGGEAWAETEERGVGVNFRWNFLRGSSLQWQFFLPRFWGKVICIRYISDMMLEGGDHHSTPPPLYALYDRVGPWRWSQCDRMARGRFFRFS